MVRGFHRAAAHTNRYGRYAGGPDPLAPPVEVQAGARGDRARRHVGNLGRARDARVPAPRHPRSAGPRRPGSTRARAACRAAAPPPARRHAGGGPAAPRPRRARRAQTTSSNDVDMDDDARSFAEMRLENLPPGTAAAVNDLCRLRVAQSRGARRLRAHQRAARPRAARPAVRRHEERPRGRDGCRSPGDPRHARAT